MAQIPVHHNNNPVYIVQYPNLLMLFVYVQEFYHFPHSYKFESWMKASYDHEVHFAVLTQSILFLGSW